MLKSRNDWSALKGRSSKSLTHPMLRYKLRTLLILLAVGPPMMAPVGVWAWRKYDAWRNMRSVRMSQVGYLGALIDDDPNVGPGPGVKVTEVRPGGPAEAGGLRAGDVISSINKRPCRDIDGVDTEISKFTVGERLPLVVSRNGESITLVVTLGKRPENPIADPFATPPTLGPPTSEPPTSGMTVQPSPEAIPKR